MRIKSVLSGIVILLLTGLSGTAAEASQRCILIQNLSCAFIAHENLIGNLAFSPDGTLLATASSDHTVVLWDVASGEKIKTLKGHRGEVWALAFSPDGTMLATGSYDFTIKLWDVASGKELQTLTGHNEFVRSLDFSPDGSTLASGSWDHTIKLWRVSTGRLLRTLKGHGDWVVSVDFSPDGKELVSGSDDFTVRIWNVETGAIVHRMEGHNGNVWAVRYSPDGSLIASGSEDKTIRIWSSVTGRVLHVLTGHEKEIRSVEFSKDGKVLVSGGRDGSVILWDPVLAKEIRLIHENSTSDVWAVAFSPDGTHITSGACVKRNTNVCRQGEVRYDPIGEGSPAGGVHLAGFDTNQNDRIEDSEFFKIVDAWIANLLDNGLFFEAVDIWVSDQSIGTGSVPENLVPSETSLKVFVRPLKNALSFSVSNSEVQFAKFEIFSLNGQLIHKQSSQSALMVWNLRDSNQNRVANGIYLYSITWKLANGSLVSSGIKRVVLLR